MCGRYLTPDEAAFERHFGLPPPAGFVRSFNVAPSRLCPVIRRDPDGRLDASLLIWGFQPGWAKRAWINARSETVLSTKAFASAARKRRCLVPAAGWYEWRGEAAPKQPYLFHRGFEPFAFAGIWTGREVGGAWQHSFGILTRQAPAALADYHDRMPVVVDPQVYDRWLAADADDSGVERVLGHAVEQFEIQAVSRHVNKPENDDPHCIEPL